MCINMANLEKGVEQTLTLLKVILHVGMEMCCYCYVAGGKGSVFGQCNTRSTAQFLVLTGIVTITLYGSKMGNLYLWGIKWLPPACVVCCDKSM